jgi:hypothetical protein
MNTNLALLYYCSFLGFLFNIFFGKVLENRFEFLGLLWLLFRLVLHLLF